MIMKGSQRGGATALANHLLNEKDNDHVTVAEIRGFMADDLHGAFHEVDAVAKGTRCKQFLFSLSLSPPKDAQVSENELIEAANRAEKELGLVAQPRAIVIHEKEGRRHAHVVWSRIDAEKMRAVNMTFFKNKLYQLGKEIYLDKGWDLPKGYQHLGGANPDNFTLAQWQQAQRVGLDPRELTASLRSAWEQSDSRIAFQNALREKGFYLAKGDRRGFVVLDVEGEVYSLSRWSGYKAKELRTKLGKPDELPSVDQVRSDLKEKVSDRLMSFVENTRQRQKQERDPLKDEKSKLVMQHRKQRIDLKWAHRVRLREETKRRLARFNTGLRGLWDWVTGKAAEKRKQNEADLTRCKARDLNEREALVKTQSIQRNALQKTMDALNQSQLKERKKLVVLVSDYLKTQNKTPAPVTDTNPKEKHAVRARGRGPGRNSEPTLEL